MRLSIFFPQRRVLSRKVLCTPLSSPLGQVVTLSTWPKNGRMSSVRQIFLLCLVALNLYFWFIAIVEDARFPNKYRMLISSVDVIFADVAQPDQARIVAHNAHSFLKQGGHVVISIKANCIDSTAPAEVVFQNEVAALRNEKFKPLEQITLEPYERDHAMVTGMSSFVSSSLSYTEALCNSCLPAARGIVRWCCSVRFLGMGLRLFVWCIFNVFAIESSFHGAQICVVERGLFGGRLERYLLIAAADDVAADLRALVDVSTRECTAFTLLSLIP